MLPGNLLPSFFVKITVFYNPLTLVKLDCDYEVKKAPKRKVTPARKKKII
jgi:hypothetical protein